ncbi:MAG: glycosyltransferase [Flavobacteriales bacterium]|nr:glycosyltransferase [Flavobacteriales bacterium]
MNSEAPLVSVIMPAYNAEKYISESILSIINQTYRNWELIIINDGSTDQTSQIIKEFLKKDKRLRLSDNETNKGLVFTRNKGLECARGKYIANLDSDDIASSDRLEKQVTFLERNLEYVLLGSACIHINEKGKKIASVKRNIPNEHLKALLLFSNYFINSSVMMRADQAKTLRYMEGFAPAEDYQFFSQLCQLGHIGNLNDKLVEYRIHDQNISSIKRLEQLSAIKKIQERALQALTVIPTSKELDDHSNLVHGPTKANENDLQVTEDWLLNLVSVNQKSMTYSEDIFNYYCGFFFRRYCQGSGLGIKAISFFKKSRLSKYIKGDLKGNSIFFVKSILKKK